MKTITPTMTVAHGEFVVPGDEDGGNKQLEKLFYLFAAWQIFLIFVGAVVGLLMAPISLFVSQTQAQAFGWMLIGLFALLTGVLAVIALPLSIIAAVGIGKKRGWGRIIGTTTAIIALVQFPLGTAFGIYALNRLFRKSS
ncbi:MAG TPA: hypothetical protein VF553_21965 [Pyrinomonadaceae bacterium]|jgi:hypothetical protein